MSLQFAFPKINLFPTKNWGIYKYLFQGEPNFWKSSSVEWSSHMVLCHWYLYVMPWFYLIDISNICRSCQNIHSNTIYTCARAHTHTHKEHTNIIYRTQVLYVRVRCTGAQTKTHLYTFWSLRLSLCDVKSCTSWKQPRYSKLGGKTTPSSVESKWVPKTNSFKDAGSCTWDLQVFITPCSCFHVW